MLSKRSATAIVSQDRSTSKRSHDNCENYFVKLRETVIVSRIVSGFHCSLKRNVEEYFSPYSITQHHRPSTAQPISCNKHCYGSVTLLSIRVVIINTMHPCQSLVIGQHNADRWRSVEISSVIVIYEEKVGKPQIWWWDRFVNPPQNVLVNYATQ